MEETKGDDDDLLPKVALTGTEKQIAWAKRIRESKFDEMILHVTRYLLSLDEEYRSSAWLEFRNTIAAEIGNISESEFWIDNRHKRAESIFRYWPPTLRPGGNFHRGAKGGRGRRI